MIREPHLYDEYARYEGAREGLCFLLDEWKDEPRRKGASNDVRRILTRYELERERAGVATKNTDVRFYRGMEIGKAIRDYLPTHREAQSWTFQKIKAVLASISIASAVVCIALVMGG